MMLDNCDKGNEVWGMGISDMTVKVFAKSRCATAALAQRVWIYSKDKTGRQDGGGLVALQYADAMKVRMTGKLQLQ